jgi:hypothetical protein
MVRSNAWDPSDSDELPSFVQHALKRRLYEFYAQRWRPVPTPTRRAPLSFWATSWQDAQAQFRGTDAPRVNAYPRNKHASAYGCQGSPSPISAVATSASPPAARRLSADDTDRRPMPAPVCRRPVRPSAPNTSRLLALPRPASPPSARPG